MPIFVIFILLSLTIHSQEIQLSTGSGQLYSINQETQLLLPDNHADYLVVIENQAIDTYGTINSTEQETLSASWMGYYGKYLMYLPQSSNHKYTIQVKPLNKNTQSADVFIEVLDIDSYSENFKTALKLFTQANDYRIRQYLGGDNKTKTSLQLYQQSRQLFITDNKPFYAGLSSYEAAKVLYSLGQYSDEISEMDLAIQLWQQSDSQNQILRTRHFKALALWKMQELDEALRIFNLLKSHFLNRNNIPLLASITNNIGLIHWEKGNALQAQNAYLESLSNYGLESLTKLPPEETIPIIHEKSATIKLKHIAASISNLALTYDAIGEPQNAEKHWKLYFQLSKSIEDKNILAQAQNNMAVLLMNKSEFDQSRKLLKSAESTFSKTGNKYWLSLVEHNLGQLYQILGMPELAEAQYLQAISLRDKKNNPKGLMQSQLKLLEIYLMQKQYIKNKSLSIQAMQLAEHMEDSKALASIHLNNHRILVQEHNYEQAEVEINLAIQISTNKTYQRFQSFLFVELAEFRIIQGQIPAAINILEKEIVKLKKIWDTPLLNKASNLLANAYLTDQKYMQAQTIIDDEISRLNFYIRSSKTNKTMQKLGEMLKQTLSINNLISIHNNQEITGFEKTNTLLSTFHKSVNKFSYAQKDTLDIDETNILLSKIKSKSDALENIRLSQDDKENIQNNILQIKNEIDFSYSVPNHTESNIVVLKDIQNQIDKETLLIQFSVGESGGLAWWITNDEFDVHLIKDKKYFNNVTKKIRTDIENSKPLAENLIKLSNELFLPLSHFKNKKNIQVISDTPLNLIPFSALPDPRTNFKSAISDNSNIRRLFSVESIKHQKLILPENATSFIVSDPVTSYRDERLKQIPLNQSIETVRQFSRLYGTEDEAKIIEKYTKANILRGFSANKSKLLESGFQNSNILHFSTHAFFHPEIPGLSSLVLSSYKQDSSIQPSFLRAIEISDLQVNSQLVILSGCETGVGIQDDSLGLDGLTDSFIKAGAKNIIASLWKINDRVTARMMTEFYKNLTEGKTIDESFYLAQNIIKSNPNTRHPRYWAGWFLLSN